MAYAHMMMERPRAVGRPPNHAQGHSLVTWAYVPCSAIRKTAGFAWQMAGWGLNRYAHEVGLGQWQPTCDAVAHKAALDLAQLPNQADVLTTAAAARPAHHDLFVGANVLDAAGEPRLAITMATGAMYTDRLIQGRGGTTSRQVRAWHVHTVRACAPPRHPPPR